MKKALNSSQQSGCWADYPTREDEQRGRRQPIDVGFYSVGKRQVITVDDFIVYCSNGVRCIAGLGSGTRNDSSVVTLAEAPEAIPIKVVNTQVMLSIRFETFEEVTGHIDHMGDVDLISSICSPQVKKHL